MTTCPVGVILPLSPCQLILNVEMEEYHTKQRKSPKQTCEKENYEIYVLSITDLPKKKQAQEGWRRVAMGPEVNLRCVLLGAEREREEDKSEAARAVGRLLGMWVRRGSLVIGVLGPQKRSKPRY